MSFCLPKFAADSLLESLRKGEIDPEKLSNMTSDERRAFFSKIVGDVNAKQVNSLFESKLLLKNQQQGIINWAKQLTGIKPEVRRDILSRVEKMSDVLQPKQLDMFLEDLAEKRLGFGVTVDEAGKIAALAKDITDKKEAMANGGDRMDYGYAKVAFENYVNELKNPATSIKETLKSGVDLAKNSPGKAIIELGGQAKSLKASLDVSALFRQGWRAMLTDPKIWMSNSRKTFDDLVHKFGEDAVMDAIKADIYSRPTYEKMRIANLAVGTREEAFPSSLPEKVPYLGRAYKASESAFTGFQYRMRADVFDKYLDIATKAGVDVTDKEQLQNIGRLVNSLTGRGTFGERGEKAASAVNNLFFSPRFLKSHIDTLLLHPLGVGIGGFQYKPSEMGFAQKMAAKNLLKFVIGTATILAIANALKPGSVEKDSRSSDFGKIRIGDTRFDVTGGMASVLTLAARLGTLSSKSSVTQKVTPLNSGAFGAQTGWDVLTNFFDNKLAPIASVLKDYLKGQDSNGNKPTLIGETGNLLMPLPITNFIELKNDPNSANILAATILDGLGISVNTYNGGPSGLIANDEPQVLQEVLDKMVAGDNDGAKALAHDFNVKLKASIEKDLSTKNPNIDPETLQQKVDAKFNKSALSMPTTADVNNYKVSGKEVVDKILSNGQPVVKTGTELPSTGIIGTVVTYAHALGVDPVTAFNRIFTGQRITAVRNGTVIVERMSLAASTQVKKDRGGNNTSMKLDHTLPLQLGGSNSEDNLKLVPTAEWASYTPVEDYLGTALKDGKVSKQDAQSYIIKFKNKEMSFADIKALVK